MKILYSLIWIVFDAVGYVLDFILDINESYYDDEDTRVMAHTGDW